MALHRDFKDILAEFAAHRVEYLIVGGYAVAFHGRPRFTKDIDFRPRLQQPDHRDLDGVEVSVLGRADLIALKRASGRPQDLVDADLLERA